LKAAGKGDSRILVVFGSEPVAIDRVVAHLRRGAPGVPVWIFATAHPSEESAALCEKVHVGRSGLALLIEAERRTWPHWVALSVASWNGKHGGWWLKIAPFLIPPCRALIQNDSGDFFPGTPAAVLRHAARRFRDAASSTWHRGRDLSHVLSDVTRDALRMVRLLGLIILGTLLRWTGYPHRRWFAEMHGSEHLDTQLPPDSGGASIRDCAKWVEMRVLVRSDARWIQWGQGDVEDMLPLFDDPRTFAVSRQQSFRAWKQSMLWPAPFRTLQPGEASQVLAPVADTILVDRRKLAALGVPDASLAGTAWMLLFWKAAAAGWRSYSMGQAARLPERLKEQPDFPMQETAFFLRATFDSALRKLAPREPELSRGAIAFARNTADYSRSMRVLVVSPFLPYPLSHGGAVRIWNLCRALADRVDFILVAVREKHDTVDYEKLHEVFREVFVVDIDERASGDESLPTQVRHHQSSAMRALIAELARTRRPDVLQIEYTHMAHFRDAAPEVAAILVEHDMTFSLYRQLAETRRDEASRAEHARWLSFERRWLQNYDGVWTVSEEDRLEAIREGKRAAQSTFTIPNGVDIDRFVPAAPAAGQEILYVGSFRHLPNILGFEKLEREVMPRVWERFPESRLRVVAGPQHEQFWKKRALDRRIEMHGFVEDLRPLYADASAVAVPLEVSAGTNIKVLEAMAAGRAVVSTPVGCAGLGLEDGSDALIRADWPAFAEAICDLLATPELRDRLARRARRTAEERFSWIAIAGPAYESYSLLRRSTERPRGA
jgi:glycosyltransferase involved in cell wall biosynthesis